MFLAENLSTKYQKIKVLRYLMLLCAIFLIFSVAIATFRGFLKYT